ncbi:MULTISPECIES: hypothetical protein [Enterobacterales]|jgi:hypothetical protein|uniref:Lipoprotein n=4 Tax=Morganellaceae TaxID=1903414 RepID=A0A899NEQ1_PROST|nr:MULTISPECIES: hypothetical protein [Enterobacterales]ELB1110347.1 hypothetical protein [Morganella morganii]ELL8907353.1 hypothetical protein [Proteus mirabilis]ELQ1457929.1 hypothetical protein [Providencia rettgeri]ELR5042632.1 hypothetical protein [Providencia rettgeri]ELR5072063.1 hypothetical protein [Providencia rettgeri]
MQTRTLIGIFTALALQGCTFHTLPGSQLVAPGYMRVNLCQKLDSPELCKSKFGEFKKRLIVKDISSTAGYIIPDSVGWGWVVNKVNAPFVFYDPELKTEIPPLEGEFIPGNFEPALKVPCTKDATCSHQQVLTAWKDSI